MIKAEELFTALSKALADGDATEANNAVELPKELFAGLQAMLEQPEAKPDELRFPALSTLSLKIDNGVYVWGEGEAGPRELK